MIQKTHFLTLEAYRKPSNKDEVINLDILLKEVIAKCKVTAAYSLIKSDDEITKKFCDRFVTKLNNKEDINSNFYYAPFNALKNGEITQGVFNNLAAHLIIQLSLTEGEDMDARMALDYLHAGLTEDKLKEVVITLLDNFASGVDTSHSLNMIIGKYANKLSESDKQKLSEAAQRAINGLPPEKKVEVPDKTHSSFSKPVDNDEYKTSHSIIYEPRDTLEEALIEKLVVSNSKIRKFCNEPVSAYRDRNMNPPELCQVLIQKLESRQITQNVFTALTTNIIMKLSMINFFDSHYALKVLGPKLSKNALREVVIYALNVASSDAYDLAKLVKEYAYLLSESDYKQLCGEAQQSVDKYYPKAFVMLMNDFNIENHKILFDSIALQDEITKLYTKNNIEQFVKFTEDLFDVFISYAINDSELGLKQLVSLFKAIYLLPIDQFPATLLKKYDEQIFKPSCIKQSVELLNFIAENHGNEKFTKIRYLYMSFTMLTIGELKDLCNKKHLTSTEAFEYKNLKKLYEINKPWLKQSFKPLCNEVEKSLKNNLHQIEEYQLTQYYKSKGIDDY